MYEQHLKNEISRAIKSLIPFQEVTYSHNAGHSPHNAWNRPAKRGIV